MDPVNAIMLGTAIIGAGSSVYAGVQGAQAASAERGQIEIERQQAELAAMDEENQRREALRRSLASQEAAAAAMGIANRPGTSLAAIQNADRANAERELRQIRLNALLTGRGYKAADKAAKSAGVSSLVGGFAEGAGSLLSYGLKRYQLKKPGSES